MFCHRLNKCNLNEVLKRLVNSKGEWFGKTGCNFQ